VLVKVRVVFLMYGSKTQGASTSVDGCEPCVHVHTQVERSGRGGTVKTDAVSLSKREKSYTHLVPRVHVSGMLGVWWELGTWQACGRYLGRCVYSTCARVWGEHRCGWVRTLCPHARTGGVEACRNTTVVSLRPEIDQTHLMPTSY
jgi:hypothetical protein